MALQAPSKATTFTRGELAALAGLTDGVATVWIRNGLLKPVSGGAGKGSHRRFGRMQVSIAAVLNELHRFGLNIKVLRIISEVLQRGVEAGEHLPYRPYILWLVARLAQRFADFDAGKEMTVWSITDDTATSVPATCHLDIARSEANGENFSPEELVEMASQISLGDAQAVMLYSDLVDAMDSAGNVHRCSWLIWQEEDVWRFDKAINDDGFSSATDPASGIYLGIFSIMLRVWSIDLDERHAHREAERQKYHASLSREGQDRLTRARAIEGVR